MRQYLTRGIGHCLLCRDWCVKCNNQESGFNDNEWFNKASATMTSTAQAAPPNVGDSHKVSWFLFIMKFGE